MRIALVAAFLFACGAPPPSPTPPAAPGITLDLQGVTVAEAVTTFATRSSEALVVDPAAERAVRCATITLLVPAPRPAAEVGALLAQALAPYGFRLTRDGTGWTLTHAGPLPPGCGTTTPPTPTLLNDGSVRDVSEHEVEIRRTVLDAWRNSPEEMSRAARIIPHEVDGAPDGLRLYGIRRSSMLGVLGFQNGDTVRSINDYTLTDPAAAMDAYARLRSEDLYRVDVERRGERFVQIIRVVD